MGSFGLGISQHIGFSAPQTCFCEEEKRGKDDGLLPTPSDDECARLVLSPYLSAFRRKHRLSSSSEQVFTCEFDKELVGCLPGLPGVRQSKEYKRVRRKISEIDELTRRSHLDHCQRVKVGKRGDLVQELRHMLLHGIEQEESPAELCEETQKPADTILERKKDEKQSSDTPLRRVEDKRGNELKERRKTRKRGVKRGESRFFVEEKQVEARPLNVLENSNDKFLFQFLLLLWERARSILSYWGAAWAEFFIGHSKAVFHK